MNLERLRWGDWIAAIAGVDLIFVTFRAWYKLSSGGGRITAWDALSSGKYLLLLTGVVGVFLLILKASDDVDRLSFDPGWIAAAVGFVCTVYIAYRLASPPADTLDADTGIFFGLAGALGVTIGGLLSAREPARAAAEPPDAAGGTFDRTATEQPVGALVPDSGSGWSSAPAAGSGSGWSPAGAPVPPATAAGGADRPLQSGDRVTLTTGGARFPAGTVAEVIEVFGGGALVEVKAADGVAERFEVPESAFERAPAGGGAGLAAEAGSASTAGESWSPAMPAPAATEDWGFDDGPAGATTEEAPAEKVPWWKRDIGGGGKKKGEVAAVAAGAAAGAAIANHNGDENGAVEEKKPGFFKRLFGGGGAKQDADETVEAEALPEGETTPATDVAGLGQAAESDTAVDEPAAEAPATTDPDVPAAVEADAPPEPVAEAAPAAGEPTSEVTQPDPGPVVTPDPVVEPTPDPTPAPEPEPAPAPDPDPTPTPEPVVVPDPEPAPEPASDPAPASEPVVTPDPEPAPEPAATEPQVVVDSDPPTAPDSLADPEPEAGSGIAAAGAGAAAGAAASAASPDAGEEEVVKPKRKRSSGSRKVPKEAVAAAAGDDAPPQVGDQVQLKVGGGKFDAGTTGTVVDVFSAGVIVELSDADGRTERLDLPFEAVGPAGA